MTSEQRTELIESLDGLAAAEDAAVLAAARRATEQVAALGVSWDELLVSAEEEATAVEPEPATPDAVADTPVSADENQEALRLIDTLLARQNLFEGTRDELLAYKEDIDAGEFQADDLRYLKALGKRLQGKG